MTLLELLTKWRAEAKAADDRFAFIETVPARARNRGQSYALHGCIDELEAALREATPGAIPPPDRFRGWLQTWIDTTARPCDCRAEIQELLKACQPGEIQTPETVIVKHRSGCAAWTAGHPQRWQEGDERRCDCGAVNFINHSMPETKA